MILSLLAFLFIMRQESEEERRKNSQISFLIGMAYFLVTGFLNLFFENRFGYDERIYFISFVCLYIAIHFVKRIFN